MKSTEVADRYAEAIYELGREEDSLDRIVGDLRQLQGALNREEDFKKFLEHPLVLDKHKEEVLEKVFLESFCSYTLNFLKILISKGREDYIHLILDRLKTIRTEKEDRVEVTIHTSMELEEDGLLEKLKDKLKELTGRSVFIDEVHLDKNLIGGIRLEIGDKVLDGSVESQLQELKKHVLEGGQ